jgi:hypothetical protein
VLGVATPCAPRTVPWSAEAFAPAIPIRHRAERGWTVRIEDPVIADGAETSFLLVKDVALRLRRSARTIHELTRLEAIPHRKRPGIRRCLFLPDELRAWEDGRPLEVRHLRRGDRVACLRSPAGTHAQGHFLRSSVLPAAKPARVAISGVPTSDLMTSSNISTATTNSTVSPTPA